ncbi:MAG: hypothetical protein CMJ64_20765 [Planctomycetaceae bacterium]|nr:hypothetical protein [Planctomycetaceae bacterium]
MPRIPSPLSVVAVIAFSFAADVVCAEELPAPPPRPTLMGLEEIHGFRSPDIKKEAPTPEGELITERYPNRAVKLQRYVVQDADRNYVNHGPWTMMDPEGRIMAQGEYQNGKRHGSWMRVMPDFGAVDPQFRAPFTSQAEFKDDNLHGVWTVTDAQQRIVGSWEFADGELHGTSTTWSPNGQQRREMKFKKGLPDGEATAWRPNGQVWGKEFFRDGKQLVPVVTWHERKQKESEGWLLRTNFTITANVDWWNGQLKIARNETEGEDVKTGKWNEWYANGTQEFSGAYDQGNPTGEHTFWHENGQKMLVGSYREGLADGRWTQWHPTGMKQEEGSYVAGVKSGRWTSWGEDGQVASVQDMTGETEIASDEDDPVSHNVSRISGPE